MTREPTDERTSKRRRSITAWSVATILLLLATYIGAYVFSGRVTKFEETTGIFPDGREVFYPKQAMRDYPRSWQAHSFVPAAWVEAKVFRYRVSLSEEAADGTVTWLHTFDP